MKHVFWVYDNELAGRPGPGVAPWQLSELKAGGFDMILSLASDLYPHQDASKVGLSRTCIPFSDVTESDDYVSRACAACLPLTLEVIHSNIEKGRTVLVHCAGGHDRTGLVLSYYIAWREGIGPAEAIAKLRKLRPHALTGGVWEQTALELLPELLRKHR